MNIGNITLRQCWYFILTIFIPFLCVGGTTYFPYHLRLPIMIFVTVGSFVIFTASTKVIKFNLISSVWLCISFMICISSFASYDMSTTLEFGIVYLVCSLMLFVDLPKELWARVIFVCKIFAIVIALTIIISVFIDDFILKYLGFISNPMNYSSVSNQIHAELQLGSYSGIAGEKASAALIMNVGIAIVFAKYFSGIKCKLIDFIELGLFLIALILTGKRMLFLISILLFVIMMLMSSIKHRVAKFVAIALLGVCAILIMSEFIPQMSVMYDRMLGNRDKDYYDPLSGRGNLWKYSFMMFAESPIVGLGFGAYNDYAYDHGYLYDGAKWNYYGHNTYYEILGETGIIGAVLIFGILVIALIMTIKLMISKKIDKQSKTILMFSFYIQAMLFIYCISGNVLFMKEQIFMWFTAMAMMLSVKNELKIKDRSLLRGGKINE